MYDPNDARQVRQREQRHKLIEKQAILDIATVMGTPPGRSFVHGLIGLCDLRSDGFVSGGPDAARLQDYLAGRRSIGVQLLGQIEQHAPQGTELMMAEAREAEAAEQQAREGEETPVEQPQEPTDG